MGLGIDPKVDYAFKKLFGSEANAPLLIDLLHAVLLPSPGRLITGVEILDPHSERQAPDDKLTVGDVRARDQGNRQFHLEMQWQTPWFFPKRVLFGWSKFHPQQLREGEHHQTLRPTYSVCFVNQSLFPAVQEHHLVFRLLEQTHGLLFSDDLEIHLIELPKFTKTAEHLTTGLDRWCFFLRHGEELEPGQLPATLDVPVIRQAMEVLTVFTKDERERAIYEARAEAERYQASLLHDAEERGIMVGQIHVYQKLLKQPQTPLADLNSLPRQDLLALLEQLSKQAFPNGDGA
jgi:predicted transposase/invertase (TIGR01784 family)